MALIYTRAYEETDKMGFNLNNFINELISSVVKFKTNDKLNISYSVTGEEISLDTDKAIPLVLIANEIIFNSIKHAFKGRVKGHISVKFSKTKAMDKMQMVIGDNGIGLEKEINLNKLNSMGLKIVNNLTNQLKGKLEINNDKGLEYNITIPIEGVE
jgi:two-component sensor histidine kinase